MKYFKLKFLLLFAALAVAIPSAWAARVTDELTAADFAATTTTYTVTSTPVVKGSGAAYLAKSALKSDAIAISSSSEGFIACSASGGAAKAITIYYSSAQSGTRTIEVYGKSSAYNTTDVYYGAATRGTLITSFSSYQNSGTRFELSGDYPYIAIRCYSNEAIFDKVEIEWETPEDYAAELTSGTSLNVGKTGPNIPITKNVTIKNTGLNPITPTVSINGAGFSTTYTPATVAKGATATIPVVFNPTTTGTFEGTMHIGAQESENISLNVDLIGNCAYELTVADGNGSSSYLPVYGNWFDSDYQINQMLYPAWMMEDLNGKTIKSMTFYAPAGLKFYNGTVTFKLANIDAETPYYTSTPYHKDADFKTVCVYSMPTTQAAAQAIKEWTIFFSEDFNFTGGSLLLEVNTEGTGYGSTSFSGDTYSPDNLSYYSYINYSGNLAEEKTTFLPKVTFGYDDAAPLVTPELVVDPATLTMNAVAGGTATATFDVLGSDLQGDVTIAVEGAGFTVNTSTITKADAEEGATVTVTYAPTEAGNHTATITVSSEGAEDVTVIVTAIATMPEAVAAPVFSLAAGTYTGEQTLSITCATQEATIYYTTDGTEPVANRAVYSTPITISGDMTVKAKAVKTGMLDSEVITAEFIVDIPEELPTITPFKGYYQIKNNDNNIYANIAGRKTMNFTGSPESAPGTVIWLETNEVGQVQSLRSQGADLQGYAERAMHYVPTMVKLVVDKLQAEGAGNILGEHGYDEIMAKFDSCFDYHLYVEPVGDSWRIYGKTPSMQPVVDFYRSHTYQVEAKLPGLEEFINNALTALRNKVGGASIFTPFSLHQIWENMGGTLPEPVVGDQEAIMDFYRAVLNNKNYVWDFAYQTAQIYWNNVKNHPRYDELIKDNLGEYADYLDEFVNQIHPDFKYYIIQRGDEPDYISEGNKEIQDNEARTLWTIENRTEFKVNIAGEQFGCPYEGGIGGYATTLYTDFAYTLPNEVTAYKVTKVKNGHATIEALSGVIPAQTPVLLIADAQGDYTLTLSTEGGTKVTGNLLCGVDSLITRFQLKTPQLVTLFSTVQGVIGNELYNQYVKPYEYLQLLYAGTVNNKYFWGLNQNDANLCVYMGEDNMEHCVFRNLDGAAFVDNGVAPKANKAFLVNEEFESITLAGPRGDVNHDGVIDIDDVTALIDYLLGIPGCEACSYCSDVDVDNKINIDDVTALIDYLLFYGEKPNNAQEGND